MSADGSAREPLFVLSSGRIDHGDNPRADLFAGLEKALAASSGGGTLTRSMDLTG